MHFKPKNWVGLVTGLIILIVAGGLLVAFVQHNAVTATVSNLNLRKGPGLTYAATAKVQKNSRLTISVEMECTVVGT